MVKSKTKTLESYWSKNLFVYLKGFFSWPKIVLTFFISYLFYLSIQWGGVLLFRMNLIFIFFFSLIAVGVYFYKNKEDQGKFIFLKSYTRFFFLYLVFIPYSFIGLFINHMPDSINSIPFVLKFGAAFLLSLWVISIYACMVVFPAKVKKELAPYKFA